jgi:DNA repair ATPase RecN
MALDDFNNGIAETKNCIAANLQEFSDYLASDVVQMMDQLLETLESANEAVQSLGDALTTTAEQFEVLQESISGVEESVQECYANMTESVVEVDGHLEEFAAVIEGFLEQTLEKLTAFRDSMELAVNELIERATQNIEELVCEPLIAIRDQLIEAVDKFVSEWTESLMPGKLDEIRSQWIVELKRELDELIDRLVSGLDEFRNELIGKSHASSRNREESEAMRELLDQALQPVVSELQRVSSLASSVGITIG